MNNRSINYNVTPIDNKNCKIIGVTLPNQKKYIYWYLKDSTSLKKTKIYLKNDDIKEVEKNIIYVSLDGLTNINDIKNALATFIQEIDKLNINRSKFEFYFQIKKDEEVKLVNEISNFLGINPIIFLNNKQINNKEINNQEQVNKQELQNNQNYLTSSGKDKTVIKDNGDKYYITDDKIYDNNNTLEIEEQKKILLADWLNDPTIYQSIATLTSEELDTRLTQAVLSQNNSKVNYMDKPSGIINNNNNVIEKVTQSKASEEDGSYNAELGIVANNPGNTTAEYSSIEQKGNQVNITNLQTQSTTYTTNGDNISTNTGSSENEQVTYEVEETKEETKGQSQGLPEYYIDNDGKTIVDNNDNVIGVNNEDFFIDYNKNVILAPNGTIVAKIGYENKQKQAKNNVNVYKRTLKPDYSDPFKKQKAGFISLPVIIFIISLILLIVSGIILLIIK
jgi:hypothetical protein